MRPPSHAGIESAIDSRPLTRRNLTGEVYERSPEVERQIRGARVLDVGALAEAAAHAYDSPAHIKDEVLCCLIRERLHAGGVDEEVGRLIEILLRRHAATLARRVRGGVEERHREDCMSEVTCELVMRLLDIESDVADFAQVRFGLYFERLTNDVVKRFRSSQRHDAPGDDPHADKDRPERLAGVADERGLSAEERVLVRDALAVLPDELRGIYILRHFDGWQVEADSPDDFSISRYCGVTPRTVRNRLARADEILRRWREGETG